MGERPLNVIGPPVMMVMVPRAIRPGSALELATTVSVAVVGTADGATYFPVASIEPQAGLHEGWLGKDGLVLVGALCVTSQATPLTVGSLSFVRLAENCCCSKVGTVAVVGVRVTLMPESRVNVALPLFFGSCTEVAVMMIWSKGNLVGSGTLFGAV